MRLAIVGGVLFTLLATVSGCGGSTDSMSSASSQGNVSGRLIASGGPYGTPGSPMNGVITFTSSAGDAVTVNTRPTGSFIARLDVGTYEVTGTSQQFDNGQQLCRVMAPVVVTAGEQVAIDVVCSVK